VRRKLRRARGRNRGREPAPRDHAARQIEADAVEITVEVIPRSRRAHPALRRSRSTLLVAGLVLVAALALLVAQQGHRTSRVARASALTLRAAHTGGVAARYGIRSHCVRRAIISRDGRFARVDFDRSAMCGAAGNHVTLILHRAHHAWVAVFDATGWRCPAAALPRHVLRQLRLCGGGSGAPDASVARLG
jgi:hypothetical protein